MGDYKQRDIFIWGINEIAEELISSVSYCVDIVGIISLQDVRPNELYCGYPIYTYQQAKEKLVNGVVVDCSAHHYEKSFVEEMLYCDGFKVEECYVDYVNFLADVLKKPVMIISGFCHTDDIYRGLVELPAVRERYLVYCFSYDVESMSKYNSRVLNRLIKKCGVYIYNHNEGNVLNFTKQELPLNCKIICVPLVRFYGIWPQINMNHHHYENQYYIKPAGYYDGAFIGGDIEINKRIELNMTYEDIYKEISADDFYSRDEVMTRLEHAMRQMEYSEMYGDLKIVSFIKNNLKKQRLFKDYRHIANPITIEYIQQICKMLDINLDESYFLKYLYRDIHEYSEMPIYPSVAKILGLEWVDDSTKYCVRSYNSVRYVDFREYVYWYYRYSRAVKEVKENW